MKYFIPTLALSLTLLPQTLEAGTVVFDYAINETSTTLATDVQGGFSQVSFFLDTFDASLGHLDSVTFSVTQTISADLDVNDAFASGSAVMDLKLGSNSSLDTIVTETVSVSAGCTSPVQFSICQAGQLATSTLTETRTFSGSDWLNDQYGSVLSTNSTNVAFDSLGSFAPYADVTAAYSQAIKLTYTFTPVVPLPATSGLMLVGVAGLAAASRLKRRAKT